MALNNRRRLVAWHWHCLLLLTLLPGAPACPARDARPPERSSMSLTPTCAEDSVLLQPHVLLHGEISLTTGPDPVLECVDQATESAGKHNEQMQALEKAVNFHRSGIRRLVEWGKTAANFVVFYRGDAPSSEAGDVILDEKHKLKSRASAEYLIQRLRDEMHVAIVANVLQIAAGLGKSDPQLAWEEIAPAYASLKQLTGAAEARRILDCLSDWSKQLTADPNTYRQRPWTIAQRRERVKLIMTACMNTDPVIQEIKAQVHKYNHRSKLMLATSRVVKTTLEIAALTPTIVSPAAQVAEFFYVMATGGPEEDKLLKELYLDKRLTSRGKAISEKAQLALENYELAMLTRNPVLLAACQSIIRQMSGIDGAYTILADQDIEALEPATFRVRLKLKHADGRAAPRDSQPASVVESRLLLAN